MIEETKLSPLTKLQKARIQLQKENPFFSYLVMHLKLKKDNNMGFGLGIDNYGNCYYNEKCKREN